jgi:hypothetical protein
LRPPEGYVILVVCLWISGMWPHFYHVLEDLILPESLSDNLSNVPEDIFQ